MTREQALRKALTYLAETPGDWRDDDIIEAYSELDDWLSELDAEVIEEPDESDAIDIEHEDAEEDGRMDQRIALPRTGPDTRSLETDTLQPDEADPSY
jgi:hypothetical protein